MSTDRPIRRIVLLLLVAFGAVGGRLAYLQVVASEDLAARSHRPRASLVEIERLVEAGTLRAEGGHVVLDRAAFARSHPDAEGWGRFRGWTARMLPHMRVVDGRPRLDPSVVSINDPRRLRGGRADPRGWILDRNGVALARSVESADESGWRRDYPFGALYGNLIGHDHPVYGKRHLEAALDSYLTGRRGGPWFVRLKDFLLDEPAYGNDVTLTIDHRLQALAHERLGGRRGAAVVLSVRDGGVLAAASVPSFDPTRTEAAAWEAAARDAEGRPLLHRALGTRYPPGSTFKVVDAAAWLDSPDFDPDFKVQCNGRHPRLGIGEHHEHGKPVAHGEVDLERALAVSCNVYFAELGVRLGGALTEAARRFGFNRPMSVDGGLEGGTLAVEPSIAMGWPRFEREYDPDLGRDVTVGFLEPLSDLRHNPKLVAQAAIGQNLVSATPLEMAVVAATVARGGARLEPHFVEEVRQGRGPEVEAPEAAPWVRLADLEAPQGATGKGGAADAPERPSVRLPLYQAVRREKDVALSGQAAEALADMMAEVIETGTGRFLPRLWRDGDNVVAAQHPAGEPVPYAGKTGTAQVDQDGDGSIGPGDRPHAWFIGFAPVDDPQVAVAVVVENAGWGSQVAAPIAVDLMAAALSASP